MTCSLHGHHAGICWDCADARGRDTNAAEGRLKALLAAVAALREAVARYADPRVEDSHEVDAAHGDLFAVEARIRAGMFVEPEGRKP